MAGSRAPTERNCRKKRDNARLGNPAAMLEYASCKRAEPPFLKLYRLVELYFPWNGAPGVRDTHSYEGAAHKSLNKSFSGFPTIRQFAERILSSNEFVKWLLEINFPKHRVLAADPTQIPPEKFQREGRWNLNFDKSFGKRDFNVKVIKGIVRPETLVSIAHVGGRGSWLGDIQVPLADSDLDCAELTKTFRALLRDFVLVTCTVSDVGNENNREMYFRVLKETGSKDEACARSGIGWSAFETDAYKYFDMSIRPTLPSPDSAESWVRTRKLWETFDGGEYAYRQLPRSLTLDEYGRRAINTAGFICRCLYRARAQVTLTRGASYWKTCVICGRPHWRPRPGVCRDKEDGQEIRLQCCSSDCAAAWRTTQRTKTNLDYGNQTLTPEDQIDHGEFERSMRKSRAKRAIGKIAASMDDVRAARAKWGRNPKWVPSKKAQLVLWLLQGITPAELATEFSCNKKVLKTWLTKAKARIAKLTSKTDPRS